MISSSTKALSKQLLGVRAVLCSKNTLTSQTLLEMAVKPANRTTGFLITPEWDLRRLLGIQKQIGGAERVVEDSPA